MIRLNQMQYVLYMLFFNALYLAIKTLITFVSSPQGLFLTKTDFENDPSHSEQTPPVYPHWFG